MATHNELINLDLKGLEKLKIVDDFIKSLENKDLKINLNDGDLQKVDATIQNILKGFDEKELKIETKEAEKSLESLMKTLKDLEKSALKIDIDSNTATSKIDEIKKEVIKLDDVIKNSKEINIKGDKAKGEVEEVSKKLTEISKTPLNFSQFGLTKEVQAAVAEFQKLENIQKSISSGQMTGGFVNPTDIKMIQQARAEMENLARLQSSMANVKNLTGGGYDFITGTKNQRAEWESILKTVKDIEKGKINLDTSQLKEVEARINNILVDLNTPMRLNIDTGELEKTINLTKELHPELQKMAMGIKAPSISNLDYDLAQMMGYKKTLESIPSTKEIQILNNFDASTKSAESLKSSVEGVGKSTQTATNTSAWVSMRSAIDNVVGATEKLSISATVSGDALKRMANDPGIENLTYKSKVASDGISTNFTVAAEVAKAKLFELGNAGAFENLVVKSKSASTQIANDWSSAVNSIEAKLGNMESFTFGASAALGSNFSGSFLFSEAQQRSSMLWRLMNQNAADAKSIRDQFVQYDLRSSRPDHDLVQMMGWLQNSLALTKDNATDALSTLDAVSADMDSLRQRGKMWAYARYMSGGWESAAMSFRDEGLSEDMKKILKEADTFEERIAAVQKVGEMQGAFRRDEKGNIMGMYNDMEGEVGGVNAALALLDNFVQAGTESMQSLVLGIKPVTLALMDLTQDNMGAVGGLIVLTTIIGAAGAAAQLSSFLFSGFVKGIGSIRTAVGGIKALKTSLGAGTLMKDAKNWLSLKWSGLGKSGQIAKENVELTAQNRALDVNSLKWKQNDKAKMGGNLSGIGKDADAINSLPEGDGTKQASKSLNFTKWAKNIVKAGGLIIVAILMVVPILLAMIAPMAALAAVGMAYKGMETKIKTGIEGIVSILPVVLLITGLMGALAYLADAGKALFLNIKSIATGGALMAVAISMTGIVLTSFLAPLAALAAVGLAFNAWKNHITVGINALMAIVPVVAMTAAVMIAVGAIVTGSLGTALLGAAIGMVALSAIIVMTVAPLTAMIAPLAAIALVGLAFKAMQSQVLAGVEGIKTLVTALVELSKALALLSGISVLAFTGAIGTFVGLPVALLSMKSAMDQLREVLPTINFDLPQINTDNLDKIVQIITAFSSIGAKLASLPRDPGYGKFNFDQSWGEKLQLIEDNVVKLKPILDKINNIFKDEDFETSSKTVNGIKNLFSSLKDIGQAMSDMPASPGRDFWDLNKTWGQKLTELSQNIPNIKSAIQTIDYQFSEYDDFKDISKVVNGLKSLITGLKDIGTTINEMPASPGRDFWDLNKTWGQKLTELSQNIPNIKSVIGTLENQFNKQDFESTTKIVDGVKKLTTGLKDIGTVLKDIPESPGTGIFDFSNTWGQRLQQLTVNLPNIKSAITTLKYQFDEYDDFKEINEIVDGVNKLTEGLKNIGTSLNSLPEAPQEGNWEGIMTWGDRLVNLTKNIPNIKSALVTIKAQFEGENITDLSSTATSLATATQGIVDIGSALNKLGNTEYDLDPKKIVENVNEIKKILTDEKVIESLSSINKALQDLSGLAELGDKVKNMSDTVTNLEALRAAFEIIAKNEWNLDSKTIGENLTNIVESIDILAPFLNKISSMDIGDITGKVELIQTSLDEIPKLRTALEKIGKDEDSISVDTIQNNLGNIGTALDAILPIIRKLTNLEIEDITSKVETLQLSIDALGPLRTLLTDLAQNEDPIDVGIIQNNLGNLGTALDTIMPIIDKLAVLGGKNVGNVTEVLATLRTALPQLRSVLNEFPTLGASAVAANEFGKAILDSIGLVGQVIDKMVATLNGKQQAIFNAASSLAGQLAKGFSAGIVTFKTELVSRPLDAAVNTANSYSGKFYNAGYTCGSQLVLGFRAGTGIESPGIIQQITNTELSNTVANINSRAKDFYNAGKVAGEAAAESYRRIYGDPNNPNSSFAEMLDNAQNNNGGTTVNFIGPTFGEFADEVLAVLAKNKEKDLISGIKWG